MPASESVLIEVRPGRIRTALMQEDRLVDLIVSDESSPSLVGNIYLGRVESVLDNLNAAFIDIGIGRSGFLAMAEARPAGVPGDRSDKISKYIHEGEKVVVQVLRDGVEDKGPKLTIRMALTARSVILTPDDPAIRISRRIDDADERARLEKLLKDFAEENEGFIVRTAAEKAINQDILSDAEGLREAYNAIEVARDTGTSPSVLHQEPDGVLRALRDIVPEQVAAIEVDDIDAYRQAKDYLDKHASGLKGRLSHYRDATPMFEREDVADDLDKAMQAEVTLPSGGTIIFSDTPALVAIDVNTKGSVKGGREQAALTTNLEAAKEIARQVRLRNLSGLLVVDFVSLKNKDNDAKVMEALKAAVAGDPGQVFVGGYTRFGLAEMTRKRTRPTLAATLGEACPDCQGNGVVLSVETIAYEALDRVAAEADAEPPKGLQLVVSPGVAGALQGPVEAAVKGLEGRLGRKVAIQEDADLYDEDYSVERV